MSVKNRELKDAMAQASGTFGKDVVAIMYCTVDSVDEEAKTCDCTPITGISDASLPGVLLNSEANNGFALIPEVGSTVIVGVSVTNKAFLILAEDLDKIFMIPNISIQMFDGSYGGMVKVIELTDKINALENLVNSILNQLKATTIPLAPSGSYPFAPLYASLSDIAPITERSDIENTKVTHGTTN